MAFKALKTNINKTKNLYTTEIIFFTHLLNHKLTLINHFFFFFWKAELNFITQPFLITAKPKSPNRACLT